MDRDPTRADSRPDKPHSPTHQHRTDPVLKSEIDEGYAELFMQAVQVFPIGIMITRARDDLIIHINDQCVEILGYGRDEIRGHFLHDIGMWVEPELYERLSSSLPETPLIRDAHLRLRRKDGTIRDARISLAALHEGGVSYVLLTLQDITEHARDEAVLRASEDRYRDLVENSQDLICTHDLHGHLISINARAAQALGYMPDELIGQNIKDLLGQEMGGLFDEYIQTSQRDGTAHGLVLLQSRAGKRLIWEYQNTLRKDDVAQPIVRGMARDVTERVEAQRALHSSEQRFHLLFEESPDAVMLIDPYHSGKNWPIVDCNAAGCRMSGYSREEILGQGIAQLRATLTTLQQDTQYLSELRKQGILKFETQNRRKDGTVYDVEGSVSFVTVEGRELLLEIDRDITQRKATEEGLLYLVEASALLVESLDYQATLRQVAQLTVPEFADWCAIDLIMEDGRYRRVALAHVDPTQVGFAWQLEERYGFDPNLAGGAAQVLRTGKVEFYPEIVPEMLRLISHDDEHWKMLLQLGLRSGLIVPLIAHGRMLGAISFGMTDSNRHFHAGDIQVALDLANRAALAVDNARLYHEAQTAIHARDEFLSVAAHELRTPMTALFGYTQLLRDRLRLGTVALDRDQQMIGIMVEQGIRLMRLLDTLLDLSRLDTGHFTLNIQSLELGALVQQVVTELQLITDQHQIRLELPMGEEPIRIDGDEQRLEQVFTNLLHNAIKYSPAGGLISVRVELSAMGVAVSIADCGIGIPAADIPHLFERYFRARSSEISSVGGLGIGLYVVNEIVIRHGGSVTVQSEQWQGSTFTIHLPRTFPEGENI